MQSRKGMYLVEARFFAAIGHSGSRSEPTLQEECSSNFKRENRPIYISFIVCAGIDQRVS